jgi:hypothetical protein
MTTEDIRRFWKELYGDEMNIPAFYNHINFNITIVALREHYDTRNDSKPKPAKLESEETIKRQIDYQIAYHEKYNKDLSDSTGGYEDARTVGIPEYLHRLRTALFADHGDLLLLINDEEQLIRDIVTWRMREGI